MRRGLLNCTRTSKRARPALDRARSANGDSQPVRAYPACRNSAVVDVDVHRAWKDGLAAEAKVGAENVKQDQDDDDQQHDGKQASASAAARFDNGRMFAVGAVIIGHGNSPSVSLLLLRNEPVGEGFRMILRSAFLAMLALAACGRSERTEAPVANDAQPSIPAPGTGPNAKTPLAPTKPAPTSLPEPKGLIDPKSVEAAGQVVQR